MAKGYIFESSKPKRVKEAEKKARAKKAAATRAARKKAGTRPTPDTQIKQKIKYLNQRMRRYGDPDHMMELVPAELRTKTGAISGSKEARAFFAQDRTGLLDKIARQIRKHPVSTSVRDAFEEVLHDIDDQISEIGANEFAKIVGADLADALRNDQDSDTKMQATIEQWQQRRAAIPSYYESQVRHGKLTPFTD